MDSIQERELSVISERRCRALIVANGTLPAESLVRTEVECADYVVAADGGANALHALGLAFHAVIGDFDSVADDAAPGVERISMPDQNFTDLDKALDHVVGLGYEHVVMMGVTGGRLDHSFAAVEMLVKYGRKVSLRLIDDIGCATLVGDEITLRTKAGQTVSLLPIGVVQAVTTEGLKWPLKGETLAAGVRDGISNVAVGDSVTIRASGGSLVVYLHRS
jgi:thiamine pyrophosphokinase